VDLQVIRRRTAAVVAIASVVGVPIAAQQIFRSGTDLVLLSVTVVSRDGAHMSGLREADFRIFEDGVLQEIGHFAHEPTPVALSLLIDTSVSMEPRLDLARTAAAGFIRRLGDSDVAQVIAFDGQVRVLQTFTADRAALAASLDRLEAGGATSLYNAVYMALTELRRLRAVPRTDLRRQAVVLLSDGEDTTSVVPYEDVLTLARQSDVTVYSISLRPEKETPTRGWNEAEYVQRSLAQQTGGRLFQIPDVGALAGVYQQIATELASQYELGYASKNTKRDGAWRRITVQAMREGAFPRTKAGYYAPSGGR
jgi:Ca-activated chloride channel family protein